MIVDRCQYMAPNSHPFRSVALHTEMSRTDSQSSSESILHHQSACSDISAQGNGSTTARIFHPYAPVEPHLRLDNSHSSPSSTIDNYFPTRPIGTVPVSSSVDGENGQNDQQSPEDEEKTTCGLDLLGAACLEVAQKIPSSSASASTKPCKSKGEKVHLEKKSTSGKGGSSNDRVYIDRICDCDVLCGRGGRSNHHPGNKKYRQVVNEMKRRYRSTEARTAKTDLSRAIVGRVANYGGRFVKKEESSGKYYVLSIAEARKKTSQALRETKELKWTYQS